MFIVGTLPLYKGKFDPVFDPSNKLLELPCILACSYEFCAIKVLPHNLHLNLDIVEENLSKPGFRQRSFNLTTLSHSPTLHID